jgi:hypothetical protein
MMFKNKFCYLNFKGNYVREVVTGGWKNYTMRSFIMCALHEILLRCLIQRGAMGGGYSTHGGI